MRRIFVAALALALACAPTGADDLKKEVNPEAAKLVGTYRIVSGENSGTALPPDRMKDVTVRIAANAITTFDRDKKQVYAATYDLDTSKTPWRIVMSASITPDNSKGAKAHGLIEKSGDMVKLIYALPEGKSPTEFKSAEKQLLLLLQKVDQ